MIAVLFLVAALAPSSHGKEYNCTVDEAQCIGVRAQTISMNGMTMCCPPFASISIDNNKCVCVETPASTNEHDCLQESFRCRDANSFTTDLSGMLRCCMPGYHMRYMAIPSTGGQAPSETCKCALSSGGGGFVSSFLGLKNGGGSSMIMSRLPGLLSGGGSVGMANQESLNAGNVTDTLQDWKKVGQAWRNWGQQFSQGFRDWGRNFRQDMRNTGLDLARDFSGVLQSTLTRTAMPLQKALSDVVGNVFRSIPRI